MNVSRLMQVVTIGLLLGAVPARNLWAEQQVNAAYTGTAHTQHVSLYAGFYNDQGNYGTMSYGAVEAGYYKFTITEGDFLDGDYMGFCIEMALTPSKNSVHPATIQPLVDLDRIDSDQATVIRELWQSYYDAGAGGQTMSTLVTAPDPSFNTNTKIAAAMQVAIWEVIYGQGTFGVVPEVYDASQKGDVVDDQDKALYFYTNTTDVARAANWLIENRTLSDPSTSVNALVWQYQDFAFLLPDPLAGPPPAPIPLPATLPMLLTGVVSVGGVGVWRRRRS